MRRLAVVLSLLAACSAASLAGAAEGDRPVITGVRVGFADQYKVGLFTPVEVTVVGGRQKMVGLVEVVVSDGDGMPVRYLPPGRIPTQLLPGETSKVRLYVRFGALRGNLEARFRADHGKVVASREWEANVATGPDSFLVALDTSQRLCVTVGARSRIDLEALNDDSPSPRQSRIVSAAIDEVGQWCSRWYGYEGVDTLILCTGRPECYRTLTAESPAIEAIDQWVRMGGTLLVCAGSESERVLQPGMPLARFVPGKLEKVTPLVQTGAWEAYAESKDPVLGVEPGRPIQTARLGDVRGAVEASEGDLPLVVRSAHGFGQIIFVAGDLDFGPLARWKGRTQLLGRLLDVPKIDKADRKAAEVMPTPYGVIDLAGQLRKALCNFANVRSVPFWVVALLILGYVALIGPGDYFLLRKVIRRMELTWITFPTIVVVVSLTAYFAAYWLKGDEIRLGQADLIDVDVGQGTVRGATWAEIFSPRAESYHLSLRPRLPDGSTPAKSSVLLTWLGLPGDALGGMNLGGRRDGGWRHEYLAAPDADALADMPIQVWSTKSVTARWSAPAGKVPEARLTDEGPYLSGTIANTLPVRLVDCWLVHRGWAYDLRELPAGGAVTLGPSTSRSELKALLTHREIVEESPRKFVTQSKPYDSSSTDVPDILQAMMFYQAAGGHRYTQLFNGYQSFVDASGLLKTDRAILIGRQAPGDAARRGARLFHGRQELGAGNDLHVTLFRFVFPVENRSENRRNGSKKTSSPP